MGVKIIVPGDVRVTNDKITIDGFTFDCVDSPDGDRQCSTAAIRWAIKRLEDALETQPEIVFASG